MQTHLHDLATAFFGGVLLFALLEIIWQMHTRRARIRSALLAETDWRDPLDVQAMLARNDR